MLTASLAYLLMSHQGISDAIFLYPEALLILLAVIIGSAGYVDGAFKGLEADTVFLGVGSLGGQTAEYRDTYWRESVERVNARRVIPIHWDSLTGSLYEPYTGQALFFQYLAARDFGLQGASTLKAFLRSKEASKENISGVELLTLPRFDPVVLW